MLREDIYKVLELERAHQERKYGKDKQQSFPGFILVLEKELQEAKDGWLKAIQSGRDSALYEIVQIAAVAIACLEKYGTEGCPTPLDDKM